MNILFTFLSADRQLHRSPSSNHGEHFRPQNWLPQDDEQLDGDEGHGPRQRQLHLLLVGTQRRCNRQSSRSRRWWVTGWACWAVWPKCLGNLVEQAWATSGKRPTCGLAKHLNVGWELRLLKSKIKYNSSIFDHFCFHCGIQAKKSYLSEPCGKVLT